MNAIESGRYWAASLRNGCRLGRVCCVSLALAGSLGVSSNAAALTRITPPATGIGQLADDMGSQVAVRGDTAAVAAPGSSVVPGVHSGTVDVYRLVNGAWALEAMLSSPSPTENERFGNGIALGQDLVVVSSATQVFTFERSDSSWQEVDAFPASPSYPQHMSVSGDTLLFNNLVFVRSGSGWAQQAELIAPDQKTYISGGSIDGDLIVAEAATLSNIQPPRLAYFFSRSGTTWSLEGRAPYAGNYTSMHTAISGSTALVSASDTEFSRVAVVHSYERDGTGTWVEGGTLDAGTDLLDETPLALDGDVAFVGSSDGTGYTFERSGDTWMRVLHFNDPGYSHCFVSVALSGSTALVGCPRGVTPSGGIGKADFFSLDTNPPPIVAEVDQGDAHASEYFGWHVAISGDTLMATSARGAYFFDHGATGWSPSGTIANPYAVGDYTSIAIDGTTAVIASLTGAYIYGRSGNTWGLGTVIPAPPLTGSFGYSAALHGDTLVIGEPDVCHVFQRTGTAWAPSVDITPADHTSTDWFCYAVSISGDTLLIGAPFADTGIETDSGAAYVFVRAGTTWTQQARLVAPLVATRTYFGRSVSIRGNTAVVGSGYVSAFDGTRGEANVFRRTGAAWAWQATLTPAEDPPGDYGWAVAVADGEDRVVVTAPLSQEPNVRTGVAYTFAFDGAQWSPALVVRGTPPYALTSNDEFGIEAAFYGDEFVVGAPYDGLGGAVYVGPASQTVFADGFDGTP